MKNFINFKWTHDLEEISLGVEELGSSRIPTKTG
jgi:hypothetical protein